MAANSGRAQYLHRRAVLFGMLLGGTGLAGLAGNRAIDALSVSELDLEKLIPDVVAGRRRSHSDGFLVLPADEAERAAYDQVIKRVYYGAGLRPIMLVIAYSNRPRQGLLQLHDPTVCYPAAGFELTSISESHLKLAPGLSVETHSFTAIQRDRLEQVIYWMTVGDSVVSPGEDQRAAILRSILKGDIADGALIRVSALGAGSLVKDEIKEFIKHMVQASPPAAREVLLGSATTLLPKAEVQTG